ncbi:MAG: hypothetical protein J0M30_01465 [Chitinophagales bacterium]|nr:hypothetical protein [Chitinophagales bacterium]
MFKILNNHYSFTQLEETQRKQMFEKGYSFLNSKENEVLTESKRSLSKELLECDINRRRLSQIHRAFYEEQHQREYDILKCVHYHSQRQFYNQGVLLLGSGHRSSMREKIEGYSSISDIKLSWTFFGDAN